MKELVILGTSAQVPTRDRNHNGYFLRWENEGILFDPGEGTQRQMTFADIRSSSIQHIAITHFHGDHCLGLPGVVQRLNLDKVQIPVHLYYPAPGQSFVAHMINASQYQRSVEIVEHPTDAPQTLYSGPNMTIRCESLDHRLPCQGYRIEEPESRTILVEKLAQYGLQSGPAIGELKRNGMYRLNDGRTLYLDDVSVTRPGQSFAYVMDTRPCENALKLAQNVDILLCEATFLETEAQQAHEYMHMTAQQAAILARESGAKRLILTHFSQRYLGCTAHLTEAKNIFPNTSAARDFDVFPFPKRTRTTE